VASFGVPIRHTTTNSLSSQPHWHQHHHLLEDHQELQEQHHQHIYHTNTTMIEQQAATVWLGHQEVVLLQVVETSFDPLRPS
jgi:hypothetical protein